MTTKKRTATDRINYSNRKKVNAQLKNVIIDSANLDGVNFENATFDNVIIAHSDTSKAINLDTSVAGIRLFHELLELNQNFSTLSYLINAIKAYQAND